MQTCKTCGIAQPIEEFYPRRKGSHGTIHGNFLSCKSCERQKCLDRYHKLTPQKKKDRRAKSLALLGPDYHKRYALKTKYGLTLEQFDLMRYSQNQQCFLCGADIQGKGVMIDHCHITGAVRKLLCLSCNTALGLLKDNPNLMRKCADYVEDHAQF